MLNPDGGIETDLTVVCVENNHFRIISSAATRERDKFHIKKHLSKDIELKDITDDLCVFGLFGPKSRDLIKTYLKIILIMIILNLVQQNISQLKDVKIWAQRLSYVGELGYELYVEFKDAKKIYELIIKKVKILIFQIVGCMQWILCEWKVDFYIGDMIFHLKKINIKQDYLSLSVIKKDVDFIGKQALEKIKKEKQKVDLQCLL